jgi:hypothetical protein
MEKLFFRFLVQAGMALVVVGVVMGVRVVVWWMGGG